MSVRSSIWARKATAVLVKEVRSELRTRYSLNALFMFAFTTLVVVSLAVGNMAVTPVMGASLYWIVIFFSSMSALAGVFIKEEDTGTAQTLRLFASPSVVFTGKLIYNFLLLLLLVALITPLYVVFMGVAVSDWGTFLVISLLGVVGLAGATTIIGAVVAKASVRGALFAVLSFPILLPLLLLAIKGTAAALAGGGWFEAVGAARLLLAYAIVMITASSVLFEFVWNG